MHKISLTLFLCITLSAFAQKNITLLSKLSYGNKLSNLWGYTDETNIEYALVGVEDGLSIVSLQNPSNPVEIKKISGTINNWREIKTYGDYVYVSSESGDGLLIVDLSPLPSSTNLNYVFKTFNKSSQIAHRAHTLEIDSSGFCYLFGTDRNQETIILDLKGDPMNPIEVGSIGMYYAHDGFVKGDTLYQAHITEGFVGVYNISDKAHPQFLTSFNTPLNFTHNIALSQDGKYLFATDEKAGSFVAAYDVSDFSNIHEIDRFQRNPQNFTMVHNTHQINDFLVNSYYLEGINILDAHEQDNLVEVGFYDTTPNDSGYVFSGVWGVYPYFPSGTIIASDINQGLYVFSANYQRASYVEGILREVGTNTPLNYVEVSIQGTDVVNYSDFSGTYHTGYHTTGTYILHFSKTGYYDTTAIANLLSASIQYVDVFLRKKPSVNAVFKVSDENGVLINNANVLVQSEDGASWLLPSTNNGILSTTVTGTNFKIDVGKWTYKTQCVQTILSDFSDTIRFVLNKGIYDDFTFDFGWTSIGDAHKGGWVRAVPYGTYFEVDAINPNADMFNDCNDFAYITGNPKNPDFTFNKVDQTTAILTSPMLDLTVFTKPYLSFYLWFVDYDKWNFANDSAFIYLEEMGQKIYLDTIVGSTYAAQAEWVLKQYDLSKLSIPFSQGKLKISVVDSLPNNALEMGLDLFQLSEGALNVGEKELLNISAFPNPANDCIKVQAQNKIINILLRDVEGRCVYQKTEVHEKLFNVDVSNLSSGMYLLEVTNDCSQHFTLKLLISRR